MAEKMGGAAATQKRAGQSAESAEAIGAVDGLLAAVGLEHGRRRTRAGTWKDGERRRREPAASRAKDAVEGAGWTSAWPGLLRVEEWERYGWLRHGFSTRLGGVSTIYTDRDGRDTDRDGRDVGKGQRDGGDGGSLNLGWTREDDERLVAENRRRFLRELGGLGAAGGDARQAGHRDVQRVGEDGGVRLVTVRQFHSGLVRAVEVETGGLETGDGRAVLRGDGLTTDVAGMMLGVQVADCVPVLVADVRRRAVAAFHAGWRGTLARIVERGIGAMRLRYGSRPEDMVAAVGPAIGPCCYAVGEELRFEFESQFAYAEELLTEVYDSDPVRERYPLLFLTARAPGHSPIGPQTHLNLWEANRRQLLDAGLKAAKVKVLGECTACTRLADGRRRYFSHRGEHGFTGRMMAAIGVAD